MPRRPGESAAITPEKLLELMKDPEQPKSVVQILKSTGLSAGTVSLWKKNIDGFDKEYKKALRSIKGKKSPAEKHKARAIGWEETFLEVFGNTGRFFFACEEAGVHHKTVSSRIDRSSPMFDEGFCLAYAEADRKSDRKIEDVAHKRAIEDESDGMIKFLLATKMPDKYGQKITKTNIVRGEIEFRIVEERAQKFLSEVLDVIDVVAEEPRLLPEAIREDEGFTSIGYNGSQAVALQERSLLPA